MKKILGLILALSLLFGLCTGTAMADTATDSYDYCCDDYNVWYNADGTCEISYEGCNTDAVEIHVPELINGYRVTKLSDCCFNNFKNLKTLILPESLLSIGSDAFNECENLKSIRIPASVTELDNPHFTCSSLNEINISSDNKTFCSVDGVLFTKDMSTLLHYPCCNSASNYTIPDAVTKINDYAFYSCVNLTSLTIPDGVVSIGDSAFSGCSNLEQLILPNTLKEIGGYAFSDCTALKNITLSDSLQTLGFFAFKSCESLREIELPFGITAIENGLFSGCTSLRKIVIPSSVGWIGTWSFDDCDAFSSIEFTGTEAQWNVLPYNPLPISDGTAFYAPSLFAGAVSIQFTGTSYKDNDYSYVQDGKCGKILLTGLSRNEKDGPPLVLELPTEYNGKPIEVIANSAFAGSNIAEVVVPEGITTLCDGVFSSCHYLTKVILPSTLTCLGSAFSSDDSLQSIVIPEGITELANATFSHCYNLKNVTLPQSLTHIGHWAFQNCYSLESIDLPDGVTFIGEYAFYNCKSLTFLKLPKKITELRRAAFSQCTGLKSVILPDAVGGFVEIFAGCTNLRWLYIPQGLRYIPDFIARDFNSLESIFYEGNYIQWVNRSFNLNGALHFNCHLVVGNFIDVKESDWFKDSVAYAYENGLMDGTSDMTFSPSNTLTRGQLVTILYRVAGKPKVAAPAIFADVPDGKYYAAPVAWAAQQNIVNGYSDGTFKPDNKITREQIATILYRCSGNPKVDGTLDFPDAEKVSNYARDAMTWAVSEGLITGIKSNGVTTLAPKNTATRAQIATIIMRYLEAE